MPHLLGPTDGGEGILVDSGVEERLEAEGTCAGRDL